MVFSMVDDDFGAIDFGVKSIADDDWQMNGTSLLTIYRILITNLFDLGRLSRSTFVRVSYFIHKDVVGKWQTSGIAT